MKILAIRGENLASLQGRFEVKLDDAPIAGAGLFAIAGPTGAGKSTLLDALCLALFGRTPRLSDHGGVAIGRADEDERLRVSANDARALLSRGQASGFAEVDFSGVDGGRYRARWTVRRARGQAGGKLQPQELTLRDLEGDAVVSDRLAETRDAIVQRLGFTFDEFRRAVVLPQFEFTNFLMADAKDRADILERVTGTAVYGDLSAAAYARAAAEETALSALEAELAGAAPLEAGARAALQARADEAAGAHARALEALRSADAAVDAERRAADAAAEVTRAAADADAAAERLRAADAAVAPRAADLDRTRADAKALAPTLAAARALDAALAQAAQVAAQRGREHAAARRDAEAADAAAAALARDEARARSDRDGAAAWLAERARETPLVEEWPRWSAELRRFVTADAERRRALESREGLGRRLAEADAGRAARADAAERARKSEAMVEEALAHAESDAAALDPAGLRARRDAALAARDRLAELRALADALAKARGAGAAARARAGDARSKAGTRAAEAERLRASRASREAARDEARRAADDAALARSHEAERAHLVDGKPCPLCGATEHPWAGGSPLAALADRNAARVAELEAEVERLRRDEEAARTAAALAARDADAAEAEAARHEAEAATAEAGWAARAAEGDPAPQAEGAADALARAWADADRQLAAVRAEEDEAGRRAARAREARAVADRARAAREQAEAAWREAERNAAELATAAGEAERAAARATSDAAAISDGLAGPLEAWSGWRERLRADAGAFARALAATVAAHAERKAQRDAAAERLATIAPALEAARATAAERARTVGDRARALAEAEAERARLAAERAPLFGGRSVADAEAAAERGVRGAEAALEAARAAREGALTARAAAESAAAAAGRARDARAGDAARTREALATALGHAGLPDAPPAEARRAAAALEAGRREDATEVQLQLRQDDDRRARATDLAPRVAAQRARRDLAARLSDLIGSADGKKFRVFAQGLTLDALLGHANAHLRELAPRYGLERVPGHDLELQVVDHDMGDEVRSIRSLSGGETFLVSLALALGLSALSSRTTRVETLFIDEGFGTLDREALDHAMSALEGLQATGRTVGIITHVPELQERVGVQVRVEPVGGGRSRVSTVSTADLAA